MERIHLIIYGLQLSSFLGNPSGYPIGDVTGIGLEGLRVSVKVLFIVTSLIPFNKTDLVV
jgi:hypothetical protein